MKTNELLSNFSVEAAKKAGIPEIKINHVSFMGEPCNGNMHIVGKYPNGDHYENNITGELANVGTSWEDFTYEEIVPDDEDNAIGFAVIIGKDWL